MANAGSSRVLPADYSLAVAAGQVLLTRRPSDQDRAKLDLAVAAARAAGVTGTAAALAAAAAAWLAGSATNEALQDALTDFTTPFATRVSRPVRAAEPDHRGLVEGEAPLFSHAARVAAAMESDR